MQIWLSDLLRPLLAVVIVLFTTPLTAQIKPSVPSQHSSKLSGQSAASRQQALDLAFDRAMQDLDAGRIAAADRLLNAGLKQAMELQDLPRVERFAHNLGLLHKRLGHWEVARLSLEIARDVLDPIEDTAHLAEVCYTLGEVCYDQGKFRDSRDAFARASGLYGQGGKREDQVKALLLTDAMCRLLGEFDKSREYLSQALALTDKMQDKHAAAQCLHSIGDLCSEMGQYTAAFDYLQRAQKLFETTQDKSGVYLCYISLAILYGQSKDLQQSLLLYTQALKIAEEQKNPGMAAQCLNGMAATALDMGQYDRALEYSQSGLSKAQEARYPQLISHSLSEIGNVYGLLGQFRLEIEYLTRAYEVVKAEPNQKIAIGHLLSIGVTYSRIGAYYGLQPDIDRAVDYFQRALALAEKTEDNRNIAFSLECLGGTMLESGKLEAARAYLERALTVAKEQGDWDETSEILRKFGQAQVRYGEIDKGISLLEQAFALAEKNGKTESIVWQLIELGDAYEKAGKPDRAQACYERHLQMQQAGKNELRIAFAQSLVGSYYRRSKQFDKARTAFENAVQLYENVSAAVNDPGQVGAFQEGNEVDVYGAYASLLAQEGRIQEALLIVERGLGHGLARQALRSQVDFGGQLKQQDQLELAQRTQTFDTAGRKLNLIESREKPKDPQEERKLEAQRAAARGEFDDASHQLLILHNRLLQEYPAFRLLQGKQAFTGEQTKALAQRHPDTLFLIYGAADEKQTLLFALSRETGLQFFALSAGTVAMQKQIAEWRDTIAQSGHLKGIQPDRPALTHGKKEEEAAQAVYQSFLGPLEQAGILVPGRYQRLVFLLPGGLQDAPLAALLSGQGKRLFESYALSTCISLNDLISEDLAIKPKSITSVLCVSAPASAQGKLLQSWVWGTFDALPFSGQEGQSIVEILKPAKIRLLNGIDATAGTIRQGIGSYDLLHFATHGVLDVQEGLRSSLILAPDPASGMSCSLLAAREIANMKLNAQMAVLSACHTAQGQEAGGEGLIGLAWAFRAAGCRSVIASHWSVDDASTQALMTAFYANLKQGMAKDRALQEAMKTVKTSAGHNAPFYWAGFKVVGDVRPLPWQP